MRPVPARPDPAATPAAKVGTWNVANLLTGLRLVLVPVVVWLLFRYDSGDRIAAFGIFLAASATDLADGEIARRRGLVTDFGKIADPIADKALIGSVLVTLSALGELAWWLTIVILVRELGVTLLRFSVIHRGVIPASRGGKVKTALQVIGIALYVLPLSGVWHEAATIVMYLAVAVTVVTGFDYVARAFRLRGDPLLVRGGNHDG